MKAWLFSLSLLCLFVNVAKGDDSRWWYVGTSPWGANVHMDIKTHTSNQVWVKWERPRENFATSEDQSWSVHLWYFDCENKMYRLGQVILYEKGGDLIRNFPSSSSPEFSKVPPESLAEALLENFCAMHKMS